MDEMQTQEVSTETLLALLQALGLSDEEIAQILADMGELN